MGKYWLFGSDAYYPSGGMQDFRGKFKSIEEFRQSDVYKDELLYDKYDWWYLYDVEKMERATGTLLLGCYSLDTEEDMSKVEDCYWYAGELNNLIDQWHQLETEVPLHAFIGLTWDEYQYFVVIPPLKDEGRISYKGRLSKMLLENTDD